MTVFTQSFNLSDNVKYLNYKVDTTPTGGGNQTGATTEADRKELMHRLQEFITTDRDNQQVPTNKTLGWQRIDGADSAGAILTNTDNIDPLNDSSSAVYGFIRAKSYDYDTSGNWKYVRFKLFERNEDNLVINQIDQTDGARYLSGDRVLVLRYDTYADFGVSAEDSNAVVDSINAGINSAEADGYGSTDLDAGIKRGELYATSTSHMGYDAAYNSNHALVNQDWNANVNTTNNATGAMYKRGLHGSFLPGSTFYSGFNATNNSRHFPNAGTNATYIHNTSIGNYPFEIERKGEGLEYNFYQAQYGVNGFGDSDVSVKNSYNEIKMLLDGNGTMWGFGDQDRTLTNTDSDNGTNTFKGVTAAGADARYLALFTTQHQDDNPEKVSPYNTILFMGEYKKEFGEPVSSGNIHNGIKFNAHNLLMNNGVATPPNSKIVESANFNTANNSINLTGTPATSTLASNFNTNFSARGTNNVTSPYNGINAGARDLGAYTTIGNNSATQTAATNTTLNQLAGSGNWLMGPSVDKSADWHASNRSRSMGQATDPEGQWRSKTIGNSNIQNSTNNTSGAGTYAGVIAEDHDYGWIGNDGAQFALTEYPQRTNSTLLGTVSTAESVQKYNEYTTAASGRANLSATRLHMGYLGYVGHLNHKTAYSLNELFFGSRHGLFGSEDTTRVGTLSTYIPGTTSAAGDMATLGTSIPLVSDQADSANGSSQDTINIQREYVQEFHPIANSQTQYSVYEPILSVGTLAMHGGGDAFQVGVAAGNVSFDNTNYVMNGMDNIGTSSANANQDDLYNYGSYALTYGNFATTTVAQPGGTAKKRSAFALLGRTFGLKLFGPYTHDKYNFLDAVSIQLDADGFYAVNPNNAVDHWVVPANTDQAAFLFKK